MGDEIDLDAIFTSKSVDNIEDISNHINAIKNNLENMLKDSHLHIRKDQLDILDLIYEIVTRTNIFLPHYFSYELDSESAKYKISTEKREDSSNKYLLGDFHIEMLYPFKDNNFDLIVEFTGNSIEDGWALRGEIYTQEKENNTYDNRHYIVRDFFKFVKPENRRSVKAITNTEYSQLTGLNLEDKIGDRTKAINLLRDLKSFSVNYEDSIQSYRLPELKK